MDDTEEWRPVAGFEDTHQVSSTGRVRGLDRFDQQGRRVPGRELTPYLNGRRGVPGVRLHTAEGSRFRYVHALVAEAFIGPPPFEGAVVRHLDDDTLNNSVGNLAYGTYSDNTTDSVRNGSHHLARRTQCPYGHPLRDPNLYITGPGSRMCASCTRTRSAVKRGFTGDAKALADAQYRRLIAGDNKRMSAMQVLSEYGV